MQVLPDDEHLLAGVLFEQPGDNIFLGRILAGQAVFVAPLGNGILHPQRFGQGDADFGAIGFTSPEYSVTSLSLRSVLSRISRIHCLTAVMLVVRTSVDFCMSAMAAMPTMVLPAPHGRTMTPLPPRASPPA